jgi:putative salt-induced outer membrane protein
MTSRNFELTTSLLTLVAVAGVTTVASIASADDLPTGTAGGAKVTSGKSDVTTEGKVEVAKKDDPATAKDATEWSLNAGGLLTSGNSRSVSGTFGTNFRLRRDGNQVSLIAAANYGGNTPEGGSFTRTADNQQAKLRYDRFITGELVGFLGFQARRDSLAGLVPRLQIDPGLGYYVIDTAKTNMWFEAGYDFLYDRRSNDAIAAAAAKDPTAAPLDKTATAHSARLFWGFKSVFTEGTTLVAGLEFLQALSKNAATNNHPFRLNGDIVLNAKLTKTFSLATSFSFKYDGGALPGKKDIDTTTALSLVYTLL